MDTQLPELVHAKRLFERRIVFLKGPLQDHSADDVVAQLLALDADSADPITLYIDSPGGDVGGMFAIFDTMQLLAAPVHTRCVGIAASAGAFVLAGGTGGRSATENSRILIHQPLGSVSGQAVDVQIAAKEFAYLRRRMEEILSERTGQPLERIKADTDRDLWMSAEEARQYGMIDEVVKSTPGLRVVMP
jgi:ATP-dependent Clp protease protease subunit